MIVDSSRFLPRSFRPMYEGRGPFPGEEAPVWAPFEKRQPNVPSPIVRKFLVSG
jgi:hypothetical protein